MKSEWDALAGDALYDPARHEPLGGAAWDVDAARDGLRAIVADCERGFDPDRLWPTHPRDHGDGYPDRPCASLYNGAAGVVWALDRLQRSQRISVGIDLGGCAAALMAHHERYAAAARLERHSYLLSDPGILLLDWKLNQNERAADDLYTRVDENLRNPTREFLWGSPGTLTAALHLLDATGDMRWQTLFRRGVRILWDEMHLSVEHADVWVWTQDMYGRPQEWIGAGHGYAGNLFPILRGARWLEPGMVAGFLERAERSLAATLSERGGLVNWEAVFDRVSTGRSRAMMVQDCHGAPGIVCRLANGSGPTIKAWLVRAGELVWQAGPLVKGAGLCHGTAGNGYAFLKLHALTGDAHWLDRARVFAMHALCQSERLEAEHSQRWCSLWTGDLGVAVFVASCLDADAAFPTLDVF